MYNHHKTTLTLAICAALGSAPAAAATFDVTSNADAGAGSLRQALMDANANAETDIINMSSISGQTINLTSGQLYTSYDDIVINGSGVTIDAGGNSRVLSSYYTDLTLNDVTLTNGSVDDDGGGIASYSGDLTLNDSTITANSAGDGDGGGVYFGGYFYDDSDLTINASTISANTATLDGGGLAASTYGNVTINASTISANTSDDDGGLYAYVYGGANVTVINSTISGNTADGVGGLYIYSYQGDVTVSGSTISGNVASGDVGGLLATAEDAPDANVTVENTTIANNQAANYGGAFLDTNEQGKTRVTNSTISGNTASINYAGLTVSSYYFDTNIGPEVIIEYTTVTGNTTATGLNAGLALFGGGSSRQNIVASVISGNTAASDADLLISPASESVDMTFSLLGIDPTTGTLNKDAVSISLTGQDPVLGPLANNGGPTLTHLPGDGSPLLNTIPSGSAGCGVSITADQRGESRPADGACDIGSVEVQVNALPPPAAVPTLNRLGLLLMAGLLGLGAMLGWRRSERKSTG